MLLTIGNRKFDITSQANITDIVLGFSPDTKDTSKLTSIKIYAITSNGKSTFPDCIISLKDEVVSMLGVLPVGVYEQSVPNVSTHL